MKSGLFLKSVREQKGISINEVALHTKINYRILQAIESGDRSSLPPLTFLRGFVKTYAQYLGADVEEALRLFRQDFEVAATPSSAPDSASGGGGAGPAGAFPISKPPDRSSGPVASSPANADEAIDPKTPFLAKVGIVATIGVLVGLIFILSRKMESYQRESDVSQTATQAPDPVDEIDPAAATAADVAPGASPAPAAEADAATSPSPQPSPSAAAAATPSPTLSPSPTPTATPSPSPTSTPKPPVTPSPTPSPSPTSTPRPTPSPTPVSSPSPSPSPAAARSVEVMIEALDTVDIEISADGEAKRTVRLPPDAVQTIRARRRISLQVSDGGAINLIVNGTDRGVPGDLGRPLRVELP
jgi:cytoskeleton protein RodZ